jgi:hypothetical protein
MPFIWPIFGKQFLVVAQKREFDLMTNPANPRSILKDAPTLSSE